MGASNGGHGYRKGRSYLSARSSEDPAKAVSPRQALFDDGRHLLRLVVNRFMYLMAILD